MAGFLKVDKLLTGRFHFFVVLRYQCVNSVVITTANDKVHEYLEF